MGERQDFIALDWVAGEIEDTLKQASQALDAYIANRDDVTKLRFCLTHIHQVHGTLQMVEFFGAALLAREMEGMAQALAQGKIHDSHVGDALEVLKNAISQLPKYLGKVKESRHGLPATLLPVLNDLRAVRGESLLSETALFSPDLSTTASVSGGDAALKGSELAEVSHKLRQMYQVALLGLIRGKEVRKNLNYLAKVCARLTKVSEGCASQPLWRICIAALEGLLNGSIEASVAVKILLRQIDRQIKLIVEQGESALARPAPESLIKNLLYYVARSKANSKFIREIKAEFNLDDSLLGDGELDDESLLAPNTRAMASVVEALANELVTINTGLREAGTDTQQLAEVLPLFKRVTDTMAILGLGRLLKILQQPYTQLAKLLATQNEISSTELEPVIEAVSEAASELNPEALIQPEEEAPLFNDSEEAQEQLDSALVSVMRESRMGLEQAKESIIEFVATQWDRNCLHDVPDLLREVRGSLNMVPLTRASKVLESCERYVSETLLNSSQVPEWQMLDTLADAITSIDYYLERLVEDARSDVDPILDVAEESVAELGCPVDGRSVAPVSAAQPLDTDEKQALHEEPVNAEEPAQEIAEEPAEVEPPLAEVIPLHSTPAEMETESSVQPDMVEAEGQASEQVAENEAEPEAAEVEEVEEDEEFDPEIVEIFIEEAGEVLETINEYLPQWEKDWNNDDARTEVRRAYHTLKGSGRMVGANDIGELAWSVENMLNRVLDGTYSMDEARFELVKAVTARVPELVSAFENRTKIDKSAMEQLMAQADLLSKEQAPDIGAAGAEVEPVSEVAEAEQMAEAPELVANTVADEEEEYDNELLEIFGNEARSHSQVLRAFIDYCRELAGPAELTDELQRALHTLKGSANMAGIQPVAEVVTHVEHMVKELRASQVKADEKIVVLLDQGYEFIDAGIRQLETAPMQALPGVGDYAEQLRELLDERLSIAGTEEIEETGIAPDALNHFLTEGLDHISWVADKLEHIRSDLVNAGEFSDMKHRLDQFVHHAESVNMVALVELGQALEVLYRRAGQSGPERLSAQFFDVASAGNDALIDMLDQIAGHQNPVCDQALFTSIQDFEFAPSEAGEDLIAEDEAVDLDLDSVISAEQPEPVIADDEAITKVMGEFVDAVSEAEDEQIEPESDMDLELQSAVPEVAEGGVQEEPDDEVDEEMVEIFLEEADELIEGIDEAINGWGQDRGNRAYLDDLLRLLHTLKGGARLAAKTQMGDLSHNFETALINFDGSGAEVSDELLSEVQDYHDKLLAQLNAIKSGETLEEVAPLEQPEPVEIEKEQEAVLELQSEVPDISETEVATDETTDEVDEEMVEIFLEEADDLLEGIDEAISAWGDDRGNRAHLDDLLRLLHTLKGGARLCGKTQMGNLSHNFETTLINFDGSGVEVSDELLSEVQEFQDKLLAQLKAIKVGQTLEEVAPLEEPEQPVAESTAEPIEIEKPVEKPAPTEESFDLDLEASEPAPEEGPTAEQAAPAPKSAEIVPIAATQPRKVADEQVASPAFEVASKKGPQEVIKVSAQLLEDLVNLAGETSISRGRAEEQITELVFALEEMQITVDRLQEQVRRLDMETEAQILYRQEQVESEGMEGFDPLEMDRYSHLQQLSRSLLESSSDLTDIKNTLYDKSRDMEQLLVQQSRINTELQEGLMRSRMVPFSRMVPRLRRIVRQVSGELHKKVDFHLDNVEGELDRTVLERMVAPLEHMLRNAVDHGIEMPDQREAAGKSPRGSIRLNLDREGGEIVLTLTDDGGGINLDAVRKKAIENGLMESGAELTDHEILQFILQAGFSTASQVTQISGRGVGMDVVHSEIKQLGGSMDIDSRLGQGTRFTVRLPFTVSVNRALMVSCGGDSYAIPLNTIEGIVRVSPFELEAYYQPDAPMFEYAGQPYLLRYMGALLHRGEKPILEGQSLPLPVILVRGAEHTVAVQVDALMGSREIVVKPLGPQFSMVHGLSGATVLGDGSVVVILDLLAMIRADASHLHRDILIGEDRAEEEDKTILVMVVDDSVTVRKVTSRLLERQGMEVITAKDGVDAVTQLQEIERLPDIMLLDIEMPRMDGFEVASRVKHTSRLKDIPIIMITSRTGEKHRERALSIGVEEYMGKPYQETKLLETIGSLVGVPA